MEIVTDELFFSVIIPLYNKKNTVTRTIESILGQKYKNFEIIIVNDGSTDGGERIVELIEDSRITIINQVNSGVSFARNNGAKFAKYDYVTFLDADDTWMPNFLEEMCFLINKYPQAGLYGANNYYKYPNSPVFTEDLRDFFQGDEYGLINDYFGVFAKLKKSPFLISSFCIHVNIFESVGGFKNGVKLTEDSDFWCRIALRHDIAYTIKPLSIYFLALVGCTHEIFTPEDFEVALTLENALKNNEVKEAHVLSVKKLIVFQKLGHVKRAILTNNKLFALKRLFNLDFLIFYPVDTIKFFVICFFPHVIIDFWKSKKYN